MAQLYIKVQRPIKDWAAQNGVAYLPNPNGNSGIKFRSGLVARIIDALPEYNGEIEVLVENRSVSRSILRAEINTLAT